MGVVGLSAVGWMGVAGISNTNLLRAREGAGARWFDDLGGGGGGGGMMDGGGADLAAFAAKMRSCRPAIRW
jgi:hypothetical protein